MISVCMATYNGAKYINEQVDSILVQLSADDELIVSDDGSTDSTIEFLRAYNDHRIKIHPNTNRKGVVGNFENALSKASGDYIFLCDQDDVWTNNKVKKCIEQFSSGVDLVMHDAEIIDENNEIINDSFFKLRKSANGYIKNLYKNSFIGCCMVFNRQILDLSLPIPSNIPMHDMWIGLLSCRYGKVVLIDDKLIKYRRHGNNASQTSEKSTYSFFQKLNLRAKIFIKTMVK